VAADGVAPVGVRAADGAPDGARVTVCAVEADGPTRSFADGRAVGVALGRMVGTAVGAVVRASWVGCGLSGAGDADRCGGGADALLAGCLL
jgi:hypothetical protein